MEFFWHTETYKTTPLSGLPVRLQLPAVSAQPAFPLKDKKGGGAESRPDPQQSEQWTVLPTGTDWVMDVTPLPFCPLRVVYLPSGFTEAVHFSFRIYFATSYLAANVFPKEILLVVPHLNHTSPCPFPHHTLVFSKGSVGTSFSLWYSSWWKRCEVCTCPILSTEMLLRMHMCCCHCNLHRVLYCTYAVRCCCCWFLIWNRQEPCIGEYIRW